MEAIARLNGKPAPKMTDEQIVDQYGRQGATQEPVEPPGAAELATVTGDVIRATADKMVADVNATVLAAEGILAMLKEEAATFSAEVSRHSANMAARIESYVTTCQQGTAEMAKQRDLVLKVGSVVASDPAVIAKGDETRAAT